MDRPPTRAMTANSRAELKVIHHPAPMTAREFLSWTDAVEGRWELDRGVPVRMQSERLGHLRAKGRADTAFRIALAEMETECEALPDGASIVTAEDSVHIPDAVIRCGEPLDDGEIEIVDPVVVVQVLSPSNTKIAINAKIDGYFSLPSTAFVLIVDTDARTVHRYERGEGALIVRRYADGAAIPLDPPGLSVATTDLLPPPRAAEA